MDKVNENRKEQRLLYHWPVYFCEDNTKESFSAQIFDLSSTSMAFLCESQDFHNRQNQPITIKFSVPFFNNNGSFDTVLFERTCSIRRVDQPSENISRVTVDFAEKLFFKPGEQKIDPADAQQRLQVQAISIIRTEEKVRALSQALSRAEEQTRLYAQAKAKLEQMLRAEIENRTIFEAQTRQKVQQEIIAHIETAAKAQEKAKTESKARLLAEARLKRQIIALEKAEKSLDARAEKMVRQIMREKTSSYNEQIRILKTDFAKTISTITEQAEQTILQIEAKYKATGYNKTAIKEVRNQKKFLLNKLDRFVTDTNRFF